MSSAQASGGAQLGSEKQSGGIPRRTIVKGAAWSVPVIAVAIATPLAAASVGGVTLEFTNGPYSVNGCSDLTDVTIAVTTDGTTPAAGAAVTVVLPDGLSWADGATGPRAFVSDPNGNVVLPAIRATNVSGTPTLAASTPGANASAPVTVAAQVGAKIYNIAPDEIHTASGVPLGSVAVGHGTYLSPAGELMFFNTGNGTAMPLATDVTSGTTVLLGGTQSYSTYVTGGVATVQDVATGTTVTAAGVPSGSTTVGHATFLAPNGDLYYFNGSTNTSVLIASAVSSAKVELVGGTEPVVTYVAGGVAMAYNAATASYVTATGVPAGATAVGHATYLAADGILYYFRAATNTAVTVGSGITSAPTALHSGTQPYITLVTTGIPAIYDVTNGTYTTATGVPAGTTVVGHATYLAPNGDLVYYNAGTGAPIVLDSAVTSASVHLYGGTLPIATYTHALVC
ncbi:hypothetical protein ACNPNP_03095 [Microbacterium sp. AGC85]